jgi:hypothetical protein
MFFRRKPNPEKLLHGLRDIARDLAQQMYDLSLVNPPRTLAEINETAMRIFDDIVRGYTDHSSANQHWPHSMYFMTATRKPSGAIGRKAADQATTTFTRGSISAYSLREKKGS